MVVENQKQKLILNSLLIFNYLIIIFLIILLKKILKFSNIAIFNILVLLVINIVYLVIYFIFIKKTSKKFKISKAFNAITILQIIASISILLSNIFLFRFWIKDYSNVKIDLYLKLVMILCLNFAFLNLILIVKQLKCDFRKLKLISSVFTPKTQIVFYLMTIMLFINFLFVGLNFGSNFVVLLLGFSFMAIIFIIFSTKELVSPINDIIRNFIFTLDVEKFENDLNYLKQYKLHKESINYINMVMIGYIMPINIEKAKYYSQIIFKPKKKVYIALYEGLKINIFLNKEDLEQVVAIIRRNNPKNKLLDFSIKKFLNLTRPYYFGTTSPKGIDVDNPYLDDKLDLNTKAINLFIQIYYYYHQKNFEKVNQLVTLFKKDFYKYFELIKKIDSEIELKTIGNE